MSVAVCWVLAKRGLLLQVRCAVLTAHSALGLGIGLTGSLIPTRPLLMRHDPPGPWTVPALTEQMAGSHIGCIYNAAKKLSLFSRLHHDIRGPGKLLEFP
jgi:hypothetical protein